MTKITRQIFLLTCCLLSLWTTRSVAQNITCPPNIDWEMGDTTGWIGQVGGPDANTGPYGTLPGGVITTGIIYPNKTTITTPVTGFLPGRFTITNTSMPNDQYGAFPVVSPLGGGHAIKIGDDIVNNAAERVQYAFTVPSNNNNYSIDFLYAVVLFDGGSGHAANQQPRFSVSVLDATTGQSVKNGCYDLNFVASSTIPGFYNSTVNQDFKCKGWTVHTLNLSGLAGMNIIVDVVAGGCSLGGHWGYGYFDVLACKEFKVDLDSCNLDKGGVRMHGPNGYMTYQWWDQNFNTLVATGQYVSFQPITATPQKYNLILIPYPSVSSCPDTIKTVDIANININKIDSTCMKVGTSVQLDANIYGGSGPLTYLWSERYPQGSLSCTGCPIPTVTPTTTNFYTVKVSDTSGCKRTEIMGMGVNDNTIKAKDNFVLCRPGYTELDADGGGPPPLTPVPCDTISTAYCTTPIKLDLATQYRQQFGNKFDTSTLNNPFAGQYSSAHAQFLINKKDMYAYGIRYGSISGLGFEMADSGTGVYKNFKLSLGCTKQTTLSGALNAGVIPMFTTASYKPKIGWNDFAFSKAYTWDTAQNLIVDVCWQQSANSTPAIALVVNTGNGDAIVAYTRAVNGNVCNTSVPQGINYYTGRPSMRIDYCKSSQAPFPYTWTPGTFLQDSTIKTPAAYLNHTTKYYVTTTGESGCQGLDSVTVTVPVHDYKFFPRDTSICYGARYGMFASGTPASVQWYEVDSVTGTFSAATSLICEGCTDPNTFQYPQAMPKHNTLYAVEYKDQYGCLDTFFSHVEVRPLPIVKILTHDTTIRYGQSIQLLVSGAYMYSWSPISSLTNPNLANPYVSPTEPTTFYVWGLADDGCRNIDSVKINIDYRDNLFVPTAFTPNGDGKNDVFRVSNITFQKLEEFRVFNRWGQEIFSTNDPKKGWDGSWKGVPQDMGVYQYLIRVAYPDGFVETYKGDVTLIR
ncbi:MAG: gliding motility-associated C-terminal domain-containing protein [Bacteroidetes bacterium]|nr:gliding motility-associated C-terminal domain-containing protein [Bacteroidota bacterium]MBS1739175.1 gliding motility-associated C-terminal domain-containing protein [Bacteroidota bacterium]